jgi:hypothetical protein
MSIGAQKSQNFNGFSGQMLFLPLVFLCLAPSMFKTAEAAANDPPPCRGAFFQSPFDHQINATLLVKRGEPCQITLRSTDVKEINVTRSPKRGKVEPVPETATVVYTPNNTTGRDRFTYNSTRQKDDKPEMKQTIVVEVEILSQADYPYNFLATEPPPPQPSPTDQADNKNPPAK